MRVFAVFTVTAAALAGWNAEEGLAAELSGVFGRKLAAEEQWATNEGSEGGSNSSPLEVAMKLSRHRRKVANEGVDGEAREADVRKEASEAEDEDQHVDTPLKKEEQRRPTYPPRSVGYYLQRRAQKRKKKNVGGVKKNVHPLAKRATVTSGEH
ncbi:hypothetical protein Emag_000993 [Eimeria magna]